jgi:hypothetical protein
LTSNFKYAERENIPFVIIHWRRGNEEQQLQDKKSFKRAAGGR